MPGPPARARCSRTWWRTRPRSRGFWPSEARSRWRAPAARADLYAKIVAATPAARDQDHPRVVVWADPTTPDRTAALEGVGPSPVPWLQHGVDELERSGATFLVVACNTAHAFLPQLTT